MYFLKSRNGRSNNDAEFSNSDEVWAERNKDTWAKVLSHLSKQTLLVNAKKRLQFTFRQRLVIIGHE